MRIKLLLFALLTTGSAAAQKVPSRALLEDATTYAERYRVNLDEAVRRLWIQSMAGEIEPELAREPSFAGLWLQHEPKFRVVASFTDLAAGARAHRRLGALKTEVEIRPARWTLAQLEEHQASAIAKSSSLDFAVDSDIDIEKNQVEIFVVEDRETSALRNVQHELGPSVVVIGVERLASPTVDGGENINGCTGGFTVRGPSNEYGVITAAHCSNTQSADGVSLPFRAADQSGNQDVQWHSTCGIVDISDNFESGIGLRDVAGTQSRANQVIGAQICKYGVDTGRDCGNIASKSFAPSWVSSPAATFIRATGPSNFADPGDSGGPVYVENTAYGITVGESGPDLIYMAIDYISSLSLTVQVTDPAGLVCPCTRGFCGGDDPPCCQPGLVCAPAGIGGLFTCQAQ